MNLNELTITEAKEGLKKTTFSSVELTNACFDQIEKTEPQINALVTQTKEQALEQAKKADEMLAKGNDRPLLGIPGVLKDNFTTKGIRTTASSKVLDNFIPPYSATVTEKLEQAGMVLLGKSNLDAWAHGSSTETSDYGATKNPWNTDYLPGGSSGGPAAAVAAQQTIYSLGTETAGSVRIPAAWCGVVGLKPTYGRVSRYGVIAMASSLDCPGPITKTAEDAALVLQAIAGKDEKDATTLPKPVENYTKNLRKELSEITIGVADDYFRNYFTQEEEVNASIEEAIKVFKGLGAKIKSVSMMDPRHSIAVYTILQRSEVSSNLARFDGIRYGEGRHLMGAEAKRRIMLGTYALSAGYYDAYYKKAQQVRTLIIEDFNQAFKNVNVLIVPTSPTIAAKVGSSLDNPMFGEMADMLVEPSSIAGIPGISVPCGFGKDNMPIGMQIISPAFSESLILNVAYMYEQATEWHKQKPNL